MYRKFKKPYYISKIGCIAPLSFKTQAMGMKTSTKSGIFGILWMMFLICFGVYGLVYSFYRAQFSDNSDPGHVVTFKISLPSTFLITLIIIFIHNVSKRKSTVEVIETFMRLDLELPTIPNMKSKVNSLLKHLIVFINAVVFIYDAWFWKKESNIYYELLVRMFKLIHILQMLLYSEMTIFIKEKLSAVSNYLQVNSFNMKVKTDKTFSISKGICRKNQTTNQFTKIYKPTCLSTFSTLDNDYKIRNDTKLSQDSTLDISSILLTRENSSKIPNARDKVSEIMKFRLAYLKVYSAVKMFNDTYGFTIMLLILRNCIDLVDIGYSAYSFATHKVPVGDEYICFERIILIIFWISDIVVLIFSVTHSSELAVQEVKTLRDIVQIKLLNYPLPSETSEQLKLFANQLFHNNIEFCAVGFSLNSSFLCTVLMSICSYVTVLAQFRLTSA
ncbi:hypothetical protein L9F63_001327 [Diploptera punctata]|uniref:Gustatory receptor n=1 Tax=Diploptera punctata TaxID=6984 RepID=A0AAD8A410_DIPPU|nr:hypothetical protein L9F63_001327 [Diploptera punctata]